MDAGDIILSSMTTYTRHCCVHEKLIKLLRCIFSHIDGRLFSRWNGAWCCWKAAGKLLRRRTASLHPYPSPSRTNRNGFFQAGEPVTVTEAVTAAEVWEQRVGEGRLHPLPAIAVRRLLLWSHTRKTFPFIFCKIFTSTPRGSLLLRKVNGFLDLSVSTLFGRVYFAVAAGADWMCVPLRVRASDNGASRGNWTTSLLAKLHIRGMLSA